MMTKVMLVIMDSVGIGALPDADQYSETDCNTICNIAEAIGGLKIPNLASLGIGRISPIKGVDEPAEILGSYGKMAELSKGMDTTIGHWEIAGLIIEQAMPTFPRGFPPELITAYEERIGTRVLGNKVASGTEIINELGPVHIKTGYPIVYTSADSVFQIAAHEDIVPVKQLYEYCSIARELLTGPWAVGRVIARPFVGSPGNFTRTANRHDYSLKPPRPTILDALKEKGLEVVGVGKISDIFAGQGITRSFPTKNNEEGVEKSIQAWRNMQEGLIFSNLVEFDSVYGHRNDSGGYGAKLEEFDAMLPRLMELAAAEGILIITADHGNDPTTESTDHSREYVPLLIYGANVQAGIDLGVRRTFADLAATLAEIFQAPYQTEGESFLSLIQK